MGGKRARGVDVLGTSRAEQMNSALKDLLKGIKEHDYGVRCCQ